MAEKILKALTENLGPFRKVLDVGCGVGTFLRAALAEGAEVIKGIDGDWVESRMLVIPSDCFKGADLNNEFPKIEQSFDLVICLEVAEHLHESRAEDFISWLTQCSPVILFSAAVPGQGGIGHLNEKLQSYWASIFSKFGFSAYDIIRPRIWGDNAIHFWYRQNILVYARANTFSVICSQAMPSLDVVHPELYLSKLQQKRTFSSRVLGWFLRWITDRKSHD
jgi:SAM-dependent methyltransferase